MIDRKKAGSNREFAQRYGETFYVGQTCTKVPSHGGKRYVISSNCVLCDRAKSKAANKRMREQSGAGPCKRKPRPISPPYTDAQQLRLESGRAEKYYGTPCPHGHDGLRYRSTGNCIDCAERYRPPTGLTKVERIKWVRERRRERKQAEGAQIEQMVKQAQKKRKAEALLLEARDEYEDLLY